MGLQFRCDNAQRRRRILAPPPGGATLNGIDYLEVLDQDAPLGTPRQQTLLVRLFRAVPAGLDQANVTISGGVRERGIVAVWAQPANAVTIPGEPAPFYAALPDADHVLVVRTDRAGDFSTYRLSIGPLVPLAFDPILAGVDFSFKVQCPSSFDCAPVDDCPPAAAVEPALDYLAKDYASFRRVIFDRLATVAPGWRQRNPADVGVAVVEAVAYVADHLSYQQDAVATEAYLGTARRRVSVRRHARLLDYRMHEGTNARAWVCLETTDDGVVLRRQVGATRTIFLTRCGESPVLAATKAAELVARLGPQVFEPMVELALYGAHSDMRLYTWGDEECCLAAGATAATLRDDATDRLRLAPGDVLVFEEARGTTTGLAADADPTRRHAVRLTRVSPAAVVDPTTLVRTPGPLATDPLTTQAVVEIEWAREDALPAPFCLSKSIAGALAQDMTVVRGNVVLVDHGMTQPDEPLAANRKLRRTAVTHAAPLGDDVAASVATTQDVRAAVPQVVLTGPDGDEWTARADLLASDRAARDFVVELEENGEATLRFGDGVLGRSQEPSLVARYRTGNGPDGNVGAEAIAHVVQPGLVATRVRNPLPARGGVERETIAAVKLYAPQAFRIQERAVTEADYAAMAERHPEVQRAVATRRWTGSWSTIFVTVDRKGGLPVDAPFEAELAAFLEQYRMAGVDVEIEPPRAVPLDVRLVVCVKPAYFRDRVHAALLEAFADFFHPDNFTFGQPVYLSALIGLAMGVAGVDWVDPTDTRTLFQRYGQPANQELERGAVTMARLEIARLDNSPSFPENGRLAFVLMGGR